MADVNVLSLPSGPASCVARLYPVVLFNICDCYIRRNEGQERVIGTLLGSVGADGTVDIKNSFAVPHNESSEQVAVDIEFHRTMIELHQRVNPKEVIVGWYSTGLGVSGSDALIQDFYAREATNPVHLAVDTAFSDGRASIRTYVATPLTLGDRPVAAQFQEVQLDIRMVEAERVGFDNLKRTTVDKLPKELEGFESTVGRLESMIDHVLGYVDDVLAERVEPDSSTGRYLADTVSSAPRINADGFDKLFNDSVQDLLLVLYLANLTRTQLALAEKLNTAAQQL